MIKFRTLYSYKIAKPQEVDEVTQSVDEQGSVVTVTKKVKQEIEHEFCLQRPTRALHEDAELFFNVTVSKGIQAGLLNAALLAKRFINDGGVLSEEEKDEWGKKFVERVKKELLLQKASAKSESEKTDQEKEEYDQLLKSVATLTRDMQAFEIRQQSMFDITAEARARTRTILWWLLFLLHRKNEKGEWVPYFAGEDLLEKQDSYDMLDDEETSKEDRQFNLTVVSHAMRAVTIWYYGRVSEQGEFERALTETPIAEAKAEPLAPETPPTEQPVVAE